MSLLGKPAHPDPRAFASSWENAARRITRARAGKVIACFLPAEGVIFLMLALTIPLDGVCRFLAEYRHTPTETNEGI